METAVNSFGGRRRLVAAVARSRLCRAAILVAAILVIAVPTATASHDYWDYHNYLSPGFSYGEGQAGTTGYWNIRLSRSNCNADPWLRRRSDSAWVWAGVPCQYSDSTTNYPLSTYNASRATNGGSTDVWVNVRIDANV